MSGKPYRERQLAPPSAAGVPRRGQAKPTRHEAAILRRLAQPGAFLMVTQRQDKPSLFTYEDGSVIRNARGGALDARDFDRLSQWLDPDRDSALFGAPAQIWRARRPGGGQ